MIAISTAAAVMAVGASGDGPIPDNNKVANPSFETNLSGWGASGATLTRPTATGAPHGARVAKLTSNNTSDYSLADSPVTIPSSVAGETYTARAYVKAGGAVNNNKTATLTIREWDTNGNVVDYVDQDVTISTSGYTQVEIGYVAIASGNEIDVHLWRGSAVTNAEILYADAITLTPNVVPPNNKVANFSFEADAQGWAASGATLDRVTDGGTPHGTKAARLTATSAAAYRIDADPAVVAASVAGETYTGEAFVKAGSAANDGKAAVVEVREVEPGVGLVDSAEQSAALTAAGYTKISVPYTAAASGNEISVRVRRDADVTAAELTLLDAVSLTPAVLPPDNRITNPSFEANKSGWGSGGSSFERAADAAAPHGSKVAEVTSDNASDYSFAPWSATVPSSVADDTYTARAYVKAGSAANNGETAILSMREWDSNGNVVGFASEEVTISTGGYLPLEVGYVATADGNEIDVYVWRGEDVSVGEKLLVDAVSMTSEVVSIGGLPPNNKLANPSFEANKSGWWSGGASFARVAADDAPHGTKVAELTSDNASWYNLDGWPPAIGSTLAGETYTLRAHLKGSAANEGQSLRVWLTERDPNENEVDYVVEDVPLSAGAYAPIELGYVAAGSGNTVTVGFSREDQVAEGEKLWVDAITVSPEVVPPNNKVSNSSFETDTSGWASDGADLASVEDAATPHGTKAASLTATGAAAYRIDADPVVASSVARETYTGEAFIKAGGAASDGETVTLEVRERQPGGGLVDSAEESAELTSGGYTKVSVPYRAQAGGNEISIRIRRDANVTEGEVTQLDAVSLTPAVLPPDNEVANPSFEANRSGWWGGGGEFTRETDVDAPHGSKVAAITSDNASDYSLGGWPPALSSTVAGETYMARAYVKAGGAANDGKTATLSLREWDENENVVDYVDHDVTISSGGYTVVEVPYVATGNGNEIDVKLWRAGDVSVGETLYVDGVSLSPLPDPPPPPTILSVSTTGFDEWLDSASGSVTVSAEETEAGVARMVVELPGAADIEHDFNCAQGCPTTATHEFSVPGAALAEGIRNVTVRAYGPGDGSSSEEFEVRADHTPPEIEVAGELADPDETGNGLDVAASDGNASDPVLARSGTASVKLYVDDVLVDEVAEECAAASGSCELAHGFAIDPATVTEGWHEIKVLAADEVGRTSTEIWDEEVEGTPAVEGPPLDDTQAAPVDKAGEFLYEGEEPLQAGLDPEALDPERTVVVRGVVKTDQGGPIGGATVSIVDHPEYGTAQTQPDGRFAMAANGGTTLTLRYENQGYLPADRVVEAPLQDYVWADEVALLEPDAANETVELGSSAPEETFQSSPVTDDEGTRRQTLIFPSGEEAFMEMPDGSTEPLDEITVRATEFTDGGDGLRQMPGALPPTSAYTYAFELSADEALDAGAESVNFSEPVAVYNENFLALPVGAPVPLGYYDRELNAWVPERDGRVIEILSEQAGTVEIDVAGEGNAATPAQLAELGVTSEELESLAVKYDPGAELWRFAVDHFTPYDGNLPPSVYAPEDATQPPNGLPEVDCSTVTSGSVIGCERQVLGEDLSLTGTDLSLHYRSDRVRGYDPAIKIPLSGPTVPASLKRIRLIASIGGRRVTKKFPPVANQTHVFEWDGTDAFGRTLQGPQKLTVRIGYIYPGGYSRPGTSGRTFGDALSGSPTISFEGEDRMDVTVWRQYTRTVGSWEQKPDGLGGWSLSAHHHYDPVNRVLYMGDGSRRSLQGEVVNTFAGIEGASGLGDGGPATEADLSGPRGMDFGPDGSLYIADFYNHRVRRVFPDGHIDTVAGSGPLSGAFAGDGGQATAARLDGPTDVEVAADGTLYVCDYRNHRVRKVAPDGTITTVVGDGDYPVDESGPAIEAGLRYPEYIELAPDGTLYISDADHGLVRRVDPGGYISTVAGGSGPSQTPSPGQPIEDARRLYLDNPAPIALDSSGSLFVADNKQNSFHNKTIYRLTPDGTAEYFAGDESLGRGYSGDGGPAIGAQFQRIVDLGFGADGSLYVADSTFNERIRRIDPDGAITTVAGADPPGTSPYPSMDGKPATQAYFAVLNGVEAGPDGALYASTWSGNNVYRIGSPMPSYDGNPMSVASTDGSELFQFTAEGRHTATVNAYTGDVKYAFSYDGGGRLSAVTDGDGNVTTVEHDAAGNPTAIEAPFGQRTELSVDGAGYLTSATNPENETYEMTSSADGLLQSFTNPRDAGSVFDYDADGRLIRDEDAGGGFKTLTRTEAENVFSVDLETKMGRTTEHEVRRVTDTADIPANPDGFTTTGNDELRTVTQPSGAETKTWTAQDRGSSVKKHPDGTTISRRLTGDPRFGMESPYASNTKVKTPSGLQLELTQSRDAALAANGSLQTFDSTASVNGRSFATDYDAATRIATTTTPAGRVSAVGFDTQGRPTTLAHPDVAATSLGYDTSGRLETATQGDRAWGYEYDADGNLSEVTDSLDRTHGFAYDDAGRLTQQTLPDGRVIGLSYDENGNVASVTPPGRPAHAFAQNAVDDPASYTPPDVGDGAQPTTYAYNDDHDLTKITRPDESEVNLGYDGAGRLQTVTEPGGPQTALSYDAQRHQLDTVSAPGGVAVDLDFDGPLATQEAMSGPVSGTSSRTYDSSFRMTETRVNGAHAVSYGYDNDSLLTSAGALSLTRDPQSGFVSSTTVQQLGDATTYNVYGEPDTYTASHGSTALYSVDYARDDAGRIAEKVETRSSGTETIEYAYDDAGRLEEVTRDGTVAATYAYDSNGNRTSVTRAGEGTTSATYDAQDRISSYGDLEFGFTENGDLASKTDTGANETTSYDYDALGSLDSVELPSGQTVSYLTDGLGRRIGRKVDGQLTHGFIYGSEAMGPIAELDAQGEVRSRFVYATNSVIPDYMIRDGSTYRLIRDQLGSPRFVADAQSGAVAQELEYDEFGRVTRDTNPGFQPFGFEGGVYDPATGFVRFGARDYDAETGRWTSKDPIGFTGEQANLYGFVLNDPVNLVDPAGLIGLPRLPSVDVPDLPSFSNISEAAAGAVDTLTLGGASALFGVEDACWGGWYDLGSIASSFVPILGQLGRGGQAVRWTWKARRALGADRASSAMGVEKVGGETISVVHKVTKDGKVIHQHQQHVGKGTGTQRRFPDGWVQFPGIGG